MFLHTRARARMHVCSVNRLSPVHTQRSLTVAVAVSSDQGRVNQTLPRLTPATNNSVE